MAILIKDLKELGEETAIELTSNIENWMSFLDLSARLYKYSFSNRLYIYAQRPDADLVATLSVWNNRMYRYINKGTKGIGTIKRDNGKEHIEYVYELKDTHGNRLPYRWQLQIEDLPYVSEHLKSVYQTKEDGNLFDTITNVCVDEWDDYLENQENIKGLNGIQNTDAIALMKLSAYYVVAKRCGVPEDVIKNSLAYKNLSIQGNTRLNELRNREDFGVEFLSNIGDIQNDVSLAVLKEIGNYVNSGKLIQDKKEGLTDEQIRIYESEGLLSTESSIGNTEGRGSVPLRSDVGRLDRGTLRDVLRGTDGELQNQSVDGGEELASQTDDGNNHEQLDGEGKHHGGIEETESDVVGTEDEPNQTSSRGNSTERSSVREIEEQTGVFARDDELIEINTKDEIQDKPVLMQLFTAEEDFIENNDTNEKTVDDPQVEYSTVFTFEDSDLEDALIYWTMTENRKFRISKGFTYDRENNVELLKKVYGLKEYKSDINNPKDIYQEFTPDGIQLCHGYGGNKIARLYPWGFVANTIQNLIEEGRYLSEDEETLQEQVEETKCLGRELQKGDVILLNDIHFEVENEPSTDDSLELRDIDSDTFGGILVSQHRVFLKDTWEHELYQVERAIDAPLQKGESARDDESIVEEVIGAEIVEGKPKVEIPAHNFVITDKELGVGGAKEKFKRNIEAIKTLNILESENRNATLEEQKTLSQYVGWGGLADAFDDRKVNWSDEYKELKDLLSTDEYESARSSTLNAHYTQPIVIKAMYQTLKNLGFESGNILEPAMGVGNFFGMLPQDLSENTRLYGVELDSISGRIARKLYPNAKIQVCGYENSTLPDNFFDVAIGNVPFGNYKLSDKKYDRLNLMIHDYFFAKTLDELRVGGVMAFITSSGTLDKKDSSVRKYLSQTADFLGAIRLPNTAFKANAGTSVTSDIIFLQKRGSIRVGNEGDLSWLELKEDDNGLTYNSYFVEHPEMVLGTIEEVSGQFGPELTCKPFDDVTLEESLNNAITNIQGFIPKYDDELSEDETEEFETIPAEEGVRNFSFTEVNGDIYYRTNSVMLKKDVSGNVKERIKGMIDIRDCAREIIRIQMETDDDELLEKTQKELNSLYDNYTKKYGILSSRGNKSAFQDDDSYYLLRSLENLDEDGNLLSKADIFYKRTIQRVIPVSSVETSLEALTISINEKAKVDLEYMSKLCNKDIDTITEELKGQIFLDPGTKEWQNQDEYLSGNVREKLRIAQKEAEYDPQYRINVDRLEKVIPKDLNASEIDVRLGATWIDLDYYQQFINEKTHRNGFEPYGEVEYSKATNQYHVKNSRYISSQSKIAVTQTYGTQKANAFDLYECCLNLKAKKIYKVVEDSEGNEIKVADVQATLDAQQRQDVLKEEFKSWIWENAERREALVKKYNEKFNCIRPREYDGSHLTFPNSNPEIKLRGHQLNAVAHQLLGENVLLAHSVGAGKTYEMVAGAMESKRLGLSNKALFVVPNHLTEQWGTEFLQLYPSANILVATKKDFSTANRKHFCAKIATGNYDAIIIGHSQFEKIPLSDERQKEYLEKEIQDAISTINNASYSERRKYSIKQLEQKRKKLQKRLTELNSKPKDDVVTFEELGVDRLYVDEAHYYKNANIYTKMSNVAGINTASSQKSMDMVMKCRYMDDITNGKGIVFATGTPISNSMSEMYVMQRFLQRKRLEETGIEEFDSWASSFGEVVNAIELNPEGTGYRTKQRFSKFYNLPELMSIFKEVADIKTKDQLNLDEPEVEYHNISLEPSDFQQRYVANLAERADEVRKGNVNPSDDNMLKITNDGRKVALDQRMISDQSVSEVTNKTQECVKNAYNLYLQSSEFKGTQLIFCDLSTPKKDGTFSVYEDVKQELINKGVPEEEIEFIHDADTEEKKKVLYRKVNNGEVRFLLGSTQKLGAGTNVQQRLIGLHHLDIGWRPSDLEQREGRIIRQGNMNDKVHIFRYVTKGTFDAYMWEIIERKQTFISQIMTSKSPSRSCDDVDDTSLSYAEVKALATGDERIKEKMGLDVDVQRLRKLRDNFNNTKISLQNEIQRNIPLQIDAKKDEVRRREDDVKTYQENKIDMAHWQITLNGQTYTDREKAGKALIETAREQYVTTRYAYHIGDYQGFQLWTDFNDFENRYYVQLRGKKSYRANLIQNAYAKNIDLLDSVYQTIDEIAERTKRDLKGLEEHLTNAKAEVEKPFPYADELKQKEERLVELNKLLSVDKKDEYENGVDETVIDEENNAYEDEVTCVLNDNRILYIEKNENGGWDCTIYESDGTEFDSGTWFGRDKTVNDAINQFGELLLNVSDIKEEINQSYYEDKREELFRGGIGGHGGIS